jgi:hypothetical protein
MTQLKRREEGRRKDYRRNKNADDGILKIWL